MLNIVKPVPETGQIVTVRQRRYVVAEVSKSALPAEVISTAGGNQQHLVSLSSIEDDALGETLQVVWEIEPDAHINEKSGLPDPTGFDTPSRFDAFLNSVRWGAISSADIKSLQAPFRSGITIEDYQLDPLVRAVQMPRANLLIADDVGLGKTIEAGLIVQELLLRNRARTVLIVCPSSLQIQWRDQMRDKFGLEFRIVNSELMRNLRRSRGLHTNPWSHFPRLITSIDFLKRDRPMRLFRELLPAEDEPKYPRKFDFLIIDEAHNVAPVGRGKYATDSLRTLAIRTIAPHFEHKLFLTATPHNGYKESFTALLELLDNQRFARGIAPDRQQLQSVMVRRMKSELPAQFDGRPRFPKRRIEAIEVAYTVEEKQAHAWLHEYTELRQQNPKDAVERYATEFMMKMLKKRLFSSPAAFMLTLEQHLRTLEKTKTVPDQHKPVIGILRQQLEAAEEDDYEENAEDGIDVIQTASRMFRPVSPREKELLDNLHGWAKRASAKADSKFTELLNWLQLHIKPGGNWSNERVVIFTEYRATLNSLQEILATEGFTGDNRLMTLFGGMDDDRREAVKAAFQARPEISPVRILLATDAASEGIDLQNHCHNIIHMEIPWNPNRLEQRNGRLDRHGQKEDVFVHHFVSKGFREQEKNAWDTFGQGLEADLEFLFRAVKKIEQIREDLGRVGPVIALQVEEAMLGKRRKLDTAQAERENEPVKRMLKFERDLRVQIARHMEQLQETRRDMGFAPENVETIVNTALELAGQRMLIPSQLKPIENNSLNDKAISVFEIPALSGSWATCTEGLAHPHTGKIRPIAFDHEAVDGRDDVVLAHLNHRLVQMALRLLRAEIWSPSSKKGLHRITARIVPDSALTDPAVVAFARLVVIGGDHNRLHEEIITAGGYLREGKLVRMNVSQINAAQAAITDREPSSALRPRLLEMYPKLTPSLTGALEARSKDRMDGILKLLAERSEFEAKSIETVLNELANSIKQELDEPEVMQLELFSNEERDQLHRNIDALRHRLTAIPDEICQEKAMVQKRFENPQLRMFPVGVMFVIPRNKA